MATPELGTKRVCPKCAGKFYDLKKNPATCPACKHSFNPEVAVKKRVKKRGKAEEVEKKISPSIAPKQEPEDSIELPEFEDLGIMEDLEDLDDMDVDVDVVKKSSPHTNDEPDDEEEVFLDEDDILADEENELGDEESLDEEDSDDEDEH